MATSTVLILVVLGVFLAYTVAAPILLNVNRFIGRSWLFCPEHQEYAQVGVNTLGAAFTSGYGAPDLSVRRCTLRKPGEFCDEQCLNDARF